MSKKENKHKEQEEVQTPEMEQDLTAKVAELEAQLADQESKLADQSAKIAELEDLKLRQMAEFDNYRRRTQKEKLALMDSAGERIFRDMLPLVDDFERALDSLQKRQSEVEASEYAKSLTEGVQMIYQKFMAFLEQNQVTPIETEDKDFSTDEHEAVTTFAAGEDKKGKIIDCTQRGYKLGEKVIRFAKVVVGE